SSAAVEAMNSHCSALDMTPISDNSSGLSSRTISTFGGGRRVRCNMGQIVRQSGHVQARQQNELCNRDHCARTKVARGKRLDASPDGEGPRCHRGGLSQV